MMYAVTYRARSREVDNMCSRYWVIHACSLLHTNDVISVIALYIATRPVAGHRSPSFCVHHVRGIIQMPPPPQLKGHKKGLRDRLLSLSLSPTCRVPGPACTFAHNRTTHKTHAHTVPQRHTHTHSSSRVRSDFLIAVRR